jgi:catechol 2,3-dioxygenase-like lactoylglutathione lyase family enzyme
MIDHVSVAVRDFGASMRFYDAVLSTLGYERLETRDKTAGYGKKYSDFWINVRLVVPVADGAHVCFRARTKEVVDAFHAAALTAGGASEGAPGERPHHGDGYYAAFVRDPDGNRLEAVTFLRATA